MYSDELSGVELKAVIAEERREEERSMAGSV